MQSEIRITADGSATLYVPALGEHYHSINGSVQESMHVFINTGLRRVKTRNPIVFELGFGTGLNALLTLMESGQFDSIDYHCIDPYPVEWLQVQELSYPSFLKLDLLTEELFQEMHIAPWDSGLQMTPAFHFSKFKTSVYDFVFKKKFDLIYFDAFAPQVQPELWEAGVFKRMYDAMNPGGILVTYCAKGEVRRRLQRCGYQVERLPGPPGKREMLRAIRILD